MDISRPQAKGRLNQGMLDGELPSDPLKLIQALDAAFPVRNNPHATPEEMARSAGQRQVIDYLCHGFGVEIKKEFQHVRRRS